MTGTRKELNTLLKGVPGTAEHAPAPPVRISGVCHDTRKIEPGELFIAVPGTDQDGHDLISEAVQRGAVAIIAERPVPETDVPVIIVPDTRVALARIAAEWYGHPAERLRLVGITGTLGKTSVLSMLEAILELDGEPLATIGSLGTRADTRKIPTPPMTTPDALSLHAALALATRKGLRNAAMEVTSHALDQKRTEGLEFELGIFTNLALLEHHDYHGSFRSYAETKLRFFEQMRTGAPLIYTADDRAVHTFAHEHDVVPIGCGPGASVSFRTDRLSLEDGGSRLVLSIREPLPRLDGGTVAPGSIPLELRTLGRPNITNAALAATAALCMGADAETVRATLAEFPAPWRRMQIVQRDPFTILDDTVGHPDSISAVFEVAGQIPHDRLHVVYAIRGRRGPEINRRDAEAVAIWAKHVPITTLLVTNSTDTTDAANEVTEREEGAFLGELARHGCGYEHHERLEPAVTRILERVGPRDLVLLLGAQGMNRGAELLRERAGGRQPL